MIKTESKYRKWNGNGLILKILIIKVGNNFSLRILLLLQKC